MKAVGVAGYWLLPVGMAGLLVLLLAGVAYALLLIATHEMVHGTFLGWRSLERGRRTRSGAHPSPAPSLHALMGGLPHHSTHHAFPALASARLPEATERIHGVLNHQGWPLPMRLESDGAALGRGARG